MPPSSKTAITAITGQDGSYLSQPVLESGCQVHGIKRLASSFNTSRVVHVFHNPHQSCQQGQPSWLTLYYGDPTDKTNLIRIIQQVQLGEI